MCATALGRPLQIRLTRTPLRPERVTIPCLCALAHAVLAHTLTGAAVLATQGRVKAATDVGQRPMMLSGKCLIAN